MITHFKLIKQQEFNKNKQNPEDYILKQGKKREHYIKSTESVLSGEMRLKEVLPGTLELLLELCIRKRHFFFLFFFPYLQKKRICKTV